MSLNNNVPISQHTGNGVTTSFLYDFKIFLAADLVVEVDGVIKTLNVDYSITGIGNDTGDVIFNVAPANGTAILLYRAVAFSRSIEYQYQGALPSVVVNRDIERLWMAAQELQTKVVRSFQLPLSITGVDVTLQAPIPGRSIKWNATGTALIYSDQDPDVIAAAAAASAAAAAASQAIVASDAAEVEQDRIASEQAAADAAAYAASVNPSNIVHRTGNESIAGIKTFTDSPVVPDLSVGDATNKAANAKHVRDSILSAVSRQYVGLGTANNVSDSANDIDIAAGKTCDETNSTMMTLAASVTRQLDVAFGSGNGGRFDSAISDGTWHVFLISNGTTSNVGFSKSLNPTSAPNYPAGYLYRRIWSFVRLGSIRQFLQRGDECLWAAVASGDIDGTIGTSPSTVVASVPTGIIVDARMTGGYSNASVSEAYVYCLAASRYSGIGGYNSPGTAATLAGNLVRTNTSGQVGAVTTAGSATMFVRCSGYVDQRGKEA